MMSIQSVGDNSIRRRVNKSVDDASIFYLFERHVAQEYHYCGQNPCVSKDVFLYMNDEDDAMSTTSTVVSKRKLNLKEECMCHAKAVVYPIEIGWRWFLHEDPLLKKKMYIAWGEACLLCDNEIIHKENAYLAACGHAFHRKCIYNYIHDLDLKIGGGVPFVCPIKDCREPQEPAADLDYYSCNPILINGKKKVNVLDMLENFWRTIGLSHDGFPRVCFSPYVTLVKTHYEGMSKECMDCERYRMNGK